MNTKLISKFRKWRVTGAIALLIILSMALSMMPVPAAATQPPCEPCQTTGPMTVNIIECPDGAIIPVSTYFAVKAEITNTTGCEQSGVVAYLDISGAGGAEVIVGATMTDPEGAWYLGKMEPGEMNTVAWTLHCTGPGATNITVTTNVDQAYDYCNFTQQRPPQLAVSVTSPCEVCTNCDGNTYNVTACVTNNGDVGAKLVNASIAPSDALAVSIAEAATLPVEDGILPPHATKCVTWTVTPTPLYAPTDVTFTINANGVNAITNAGLGTATGTSTTHQRDLLVTIKELKPLGSCPPPADPKNIIVSTQEKFEVTAEVKNCKGDVPVTVNLLEPANTALDMTTPVHVVIRQDGGGLVAEYDITPPLDTFNIPSLCGCCTATITWTKICTGSTAGAYAQVIVEATPDGGQPVSSWDCSPASVKQEAKVHLAPDLNRNLHMGMEALVYDCDPINGQVVNAVAVCQDFDVKIYIRNWGEAVALGVNFDLTITGPTDCAGTYNDLNFGNINGGAQNMRSLSSLLGRDPCHCDAAGDVVLTISGLTGTDENTCEPIIPDNIEYICPLTLKQCPVELLIINPEYCTVIEKYDRFAVKARITNPGPCVLKDVDVTLTPTGDGDVEFLSPQTVNIPEIQKPVDDPTTPENEALIPREYEVTWEMKCKGPGNTTFHVCAESNGDNVPELGPHLQILDLNDPAVLIHQVPYREAKFDVEIISPDWGSIYATSQDFAVTAVITNKEEATANISSAFVLIDPGMEAQIAQIDGPMPALPWIIPPYGSKVVTFTMHCIDSGLSTFYVKIDGETDKCIDIGQAGQVCQVVDAISQPIMVWQYPAAHLEVTIDECPTEIVTCNTFNVTATITNTGEADATEVMATLAVDPAGSVRPAAGDSGYTKYIGTIPGHDSEASSVSVNWTLHCKVACESTLTITADGNDEYGWHQKQQCQSTGTFLIDHGTMHSEELDTGVEEQPNRGETEIMLVGDANGLFGPCIIDTNFHWTDDDNVDHIGHLVGDGVIIPDAAPDKHYFHHGHGWDNDFVKGDDLFLIEAHMVMDCPCGDNVPVDGYKIKEGMINVINGQITGEFEASSWCRCNREHIEVGLLGGTYCSTMAATADRAIPVKFIEPDSATVKQLPANIDLRVEKVVDAGPYTVSDSTEFHVIVHNDGPGDASGVIVQDVLPDALNFAYAVPSQGWYDVAGGLWVVGNIANGSYASLDIGVQLNRTGEICNRATVVASDQHDTNIANNSAEACITVAYLQTDNITSWNCCLDKGFNLISLALIPEDPTLTVVLEDVVSTDNILVKAAGWDAQDMITPWMYWWGNAPDPVHSELQDIWDGLGYWLYTSDTGCFSYDGYELSAPFPATPPAYDVWPGWNLVGFKSVVPKKASAYLDDIAGKYGVMYGFDNGAYFIAGTPGNEYLQPCLGYWLAVYEHGIIYP